MPGQIALSSWQIVGLFILMPYNFILMISKQLRPLCIDSAEKCLAFFFAGVAVRVPKSNCTKVVKISAYSSAYMLKQTKVSRDFSYSL